MPIKKIKAHAGIKSNAGKIALQRGPVVYCLEEVDNGAGIFDLILPDNASFSSKFQQDLLGGIVTIEGEAILIGKNGSEKKSIITAIPYYSWANRGPGKMLVWIPEINNEN